MRAVGAVTAALARPLHHHPMPGITTVPTFLASVQQKLISSSVNPPVAVVLGAPVQLVSI